MARRSETAGCQRTAAFGKRVPVRGLFARVIAAEHSPRPSPHPAQSSPRRRVGRVSALCVCVRACVSRVGAGERGDGERRVSVFVRGWGRDRCLVRFEIRGRSADAPRFPRPTRLSSLRPLLLLPLPPPLPRPYLPSSSAPATPALTPSDTFCQPCSASRVPPADHGTPASPITPCQSARTQGY